MEPAVSYLEDDEFSVNFATHGEADVLDGRMAQTPVAAFDAVLAQLDAPAGDAAGSSGTAGASLDGESNAIVPHAKPVSPSGDGQPGENFVAHFTVDSRPEIGVWPAGTVGVGGHYWDVLGRDGALNPKLRLLVCQDGSLACASLPRQSDTNEVAATRTLRWDGLDGIPVAVRPRGTGPDVTIDGFRDAPPPDHKYGPIILAADGTDPKSQESQTRAVPLEDLIALGHGIVAGRLDAGIYEV
jgi:hypothetical protein